MATYTTRDAVRTELGLSSTQLTDAAADKLIADAEDLVDQELGAYCVDEDTGRKIVEDDVDDWQWEKLQRAAAKVAALLYTDPTLPYQQFGSSSVGRQNTSQPIGSRLGPVIGAVLNETGLRKLTTRAR